MTSSSSRKDRARSLKAIPKTLKIKTARKKSKSQQKKKRRERRKRKRESKRRKPNKKRLPRQTQSRSRRRNLVQKLSTQNKRTIMIPARHC